MMQKQANTHIQQQMNPRSGVAMIEMAIILPVLMLFLFGVIEFGALFLKHQQVANAIGAGVHAVQIDPLDPQNQTLLNSSDGLVNFDKPNTFGCARAYRTRELAQAGICREGDWRTSEPAGLRDDDDYYYVMLRVHARVESLSGMINEFLPNIDQRQVVKIQRESARCDVGEIEVSDGEGGTLCARHPDFCNGEWRENRACIITKYVGVGTRPAGGFGLPVARCVREYLIDAPLCQDSGWDCEQLAQLYNNPGGGLLGDGRVDFEDSSLIPGAGFFTSTGAAEAEFVDVSGDLSSYDFEEVDCP